MSQVSYDCSEPTDTEPALVPSECRLRLRVDQYRQMGESGIFTEDDKVELIGGVLVAKGKMGQAHARLIQKLTGLLVRGVGPEYAVRVQLPLTLDDFSEPEPDFAVVHAGDVGEGENHPGTALLAVEIALGSLRLDRGVKATLYARAGIPEYWIVNLRDATVEVHREPDAARGRYGTRLTRSGQDTLAPGSLPGPRLVVASLFDTSP